MCRFVWLGGGGVDGGKEWLFDEDEVTRLKRLIY